MANYVIGSATKDGLMHRGWFVGHFMDKSTQNCTGAIEVKWDDLKKGTKRDAWSVNAIAHTLGIIVSGKVRLIFEDNSFDLGPGEYFLSEPNVPHKYEVLEDSLAISVRWPSLSGDHVNNK